MGKKAEAIRYAEDSRGLNDPGWQIAEACEAVLLSSGLAEEAYRRYAIAANQGTTNLATFRAITKKYPHVPPEQVLQDLIAGAKPAVNFGEFAGGAMAATGSAKGKSDAEIDQAAKAYMSQHKGVNYADALTAVTSFTTQA